MVSISETTRTILFASALSYSSSRAPPMPLTAARASFIAVISFTRRRRDSEKTGSRLSASFPVRATCTIPNFRHACWNARFLPGSPVVANVRVVSEVSTTLARNTLPSSTISGRCAGDARTLMSIKPRSTHILSVTFSTLRTFASLLICLMSFIASLSLAITTTVKMALSTLRPTARDSMLYPRRANTPATRLIMPVSSAT